MSCHSAGMLAYAHTLAIREGAWVVDRHVLRATSHVDRTFSKTLDSMGEQRSQHGMFACSTVRLACICQRALILKLHQSSSYIHITDSYSYIDSFIQTMMIHSTQSESFFCCIVYSFIKPDHSQLLSTYFRSSHRQIFPYSVSDCSLLKAFFIRCSSQCC